MRLGDSANTGRKLADAFPVRKTKDDSGHEHDERGRFTSAGESHAKAIDALSEHYGGAATGAARDQELYTQEREARRAAASRALGGDAQRTQMPRMGDGGRVGGDQLKPDEKAHVHGLLAHIGSFLGGKKTAKQRIEEENTDPKTGAVDYDHAINQRRVGGHLPPSTTNHPAGVFMVGGGGCQPAGAKVLMASGRFGNVEDVRAGDLVMSPQADGSVVQARVSEVFFYRSEPIFRVGIKARTAGARDVFYLASGNHILPLRVWSREWDYANAIPGRRNDTRETRYFQETKEMRVADYLLKSERFKADARIFFSPPVEMPLETHDIAPYIMGAMLGDGCLSTKTEPKFSSDPDAAVMRSMLELGADFSKPTRKPGSKIATRYDARGAFSKKLKRSEIYGKLAHFKRVPEPYMRGSLTQRLELLAGLIDTDGTHNEYATVSRGLAEDFVNLMRSVGGSAYLVARQTKCLGKWFPSFRVIYSVSEYPIPVRLERKRNPERQFDWKNHRMRCVDVQPHGVADVYGFTVESDSSWFITDNWLVTHNSGKGSIVEDYVGNGGSKRKDGTKIQPGDADFKAPLHGFHPDRVFDSDAEKKKMPLYTNQTGKRRDGSDAPSSDMYGASGPKTGADLAKYTPEEQEAMHEYVRRTTGFKDAHDFARNMITGPRNPKAAAAGDLSHGHFNDGTAGDTEFDGGLTHELSSHIVKQKLAHAMAHPEEGSFVYDSTGSDKYMGWADKAMKNGFQTRLHSADASPEVAQYRNQGRERTVDPALLAGTHRKVAEIMPKLQEWSDQQVAAGRPHEFMHTPTMTDEDHAEALNAGMTADGPLAGFMHPKKKAAQERKRISGAWDRIRGKS